MKSKRKNIIGDLGCSGLGAVISLATDPNTITEAIFLDCITAWTSERLHDTIL